MSILEVLFLCALSSFITFTWLRKKDDNHIIEIIYINGTTGKRIHDEYSISELRNGKKSKR